MASGDSFFQVSRRAMLSAFATLPALPVLLPGSALAQLPASPTGQAAVTDPLPSWNDTAPKKAIFEFVERVTRQGSADFVPTAERIATFDNDVYQPMLELTAYLRTNGFKTFIVSGGGIDFMRPWTDKTYGIPPEQVVGSSGKTKFEMLNGKPVLMRLPEINFINDGPGKPVGINEHIGLRPIAAFGNSDGDMQMLQYTTGSGGARFGRLVHHTDAEREWAYDRKSSVGKLDQALDAAPAAGWIVMDMKNDWKTIFPFGSK